MNIAGVSYRNFFLRVWSALPAPLLPRIARAERDSRGASLWRKLQNGRHI